MRNPDASSTSSSEGARAWWTLALPCVAVIAAFACVVYAYRVELGRVGGGDFNPERAVLRRLEEWSTAPRSNGSVVFFGDSLSLCSTPPSKAADRVARWLTVDLEQAGLRADVLDVSQAGFTPLVFYAYLDEAIARPVQLVVVDVNLRPLTYPKRRPGADRLPQIARRLDAGKIVRVRASLDYDGVSPFDPYLQRVKEKLGMLYTFQGLRQAALDRLAAWGRSASRTLGLRARKLPSLAAFNRETNRNYDIDYASHPMVDTLRAMAEDLHARHIPVLFYVAPIDVEHLQASGEYDPVGMPERLEALRRAIGATQGEWLDLHDLLPSAVFRDRQNHLNKEGCAQVAGPIAAHALHLLPPELVAARKPAPRWQKAKRAPALEP